MGTLLAVNLLDVCRALGDDPRGATGKSVESWLRAEYLKKRGGGFNHNDAIDCLGHMFAGNMSQISAEAHCEKNKLKAARDANKSIVKALGPFAVENVSRIYSQSFCAVLISRWKGRSIYILVKAPFVRVRHDEAYVEWMGLRSTFCPTKKQLAFGFGFIRNFVIPKDFQSAEIEYLGTQNGSIKKVRYPKIIRENDLPSYFGVDVDKCLQSYVDGVVAILEDKPQSRPDLSQYRIIDPNQKGLFS
jgi:hypothetical protein